MTRTITDLMLRLRHSDRLEWKVPGVTYKNVTAC
jgi:hypothetical protein